MMLTRICRRVAPLLALCAGLALLPAHAQTPGAAPPAGGAGREIAPSADSKATESLLRERAREVTRVLGEAPLTAAGGTIGVGTTDLSGDVPVVVVREGLAARVFTLDAGTVRAEASEAQWDAAFADVDGDGRTDVIVRMTGKRADGSPVAWAQAFLAPPPSVQAIRLEADVATSLATMDAVDARSAAHAAATLPSGGVSHDDACRDAGREDAALRRAEHAHLAPEGRAGGQDRHGRRARAGRPLRRPVVRRRATVLLLDLGGRLDPRMVRVARWAAHHRRRRGLPRRVIGSRRP